jgi:hypothetical protein
MVVIPGNGVRGMFCGNITKFDSASRVSFNWSLIVAAELGAVEADVELGSF